MAVGSDKNFAAELFDLTDRVVLVTGGSRGLGGRWRSRPPAVVPMW
jgi:hypothetical protein